MLLARYLLFGVVLPAVAPPESPPRFELVQPELFSATGGMPNAWSQPSFYSARSAVVGSTRAARQAGT
jgi:hypothetical protein